MRQARNSLKILKRQARNSLKILTFEKKQLLLFCSFSLQGNCFSTPAIFAILLDVTRPGVFEVEMCSG